MPSAVRLRDDYSAEALRALARRSKDANQSRRLLSLAAVREGIDRGSAAKIGGMDRQMLRDCPSLQRVGSGGPPPLRSMARLGQSKPTRVYITTPFHFGFDCELAEINRSRVWLPGARTRWELH